MPSSKRNSRRCKLLCPRRRPHPWRNLGVPAYELVSRYGPHHAPTFKVKVALGKHGEAEAEGDSKQEAETAAAAALVEKLLPSRPAGGAGVSRRHESPRP